MSGLPQTICTREALHEVDVYDKDWAKKQVWCVDWKRYRLPFCSVYVIAPEGHWPSKIGISQHARKRVQGLQTSHWKMLTVPQCWYAPTVRDARAVELKVHQTLKQDNCFLLGEWFDKHPDKAAEVVEFVALTLGVELKSTIEQADIITDVEYEMGLMLESVQDLKRLMAGPWGREGNAINYLTGKKYD